MSIAVEVTSSGLVTCFAFLLPTPTCTAVYPSFASVFTCVTYEQRSTRGVLERIREQSLRVGGRIRLSASVVAGRTWQSSSQTRGASGCGCAGKASGGARRAAVATRVARGCAGGARGAARGRAARRSHRALHSCAGQGSHVQRGAVEERDGASGGLARGAARGGVSRVSKKRRRRRNNG